jgi:Domain of unknown function (DUF1830)
MVNVQRAAINKSIVLTKERGQTTRSNSQQNSTSARDASYSEQILCYYANTTNQIQIIRSAKIANCYFERVVFPGQRLLFETVPEAQIEIHTGTMVTAILSDRIPCSRLRVYTD